MNTTNATTYSIYFQNVAAVTVMRAGDLTLMEIAG